MAKRAAAKTPAMPATPPSGTNTTVRTNRDGTVMRKKTFWFEDTTLHAFEVWCVTNRRDPGDTITEFLRSVVGKKP